MKQKVEITLSGSPETGVAARMPRGIRMNDLAEMISFLIHCYCKERVCKPGRVIGKVERRLHKDYGYRIYKCMIREDDEDE